MNNIRTPGRNVSVGPGVRKLNPQLSGSATVSTPEAHAIMIKGYAPAKPKTRLHQSSKPLMNKLETEFYCWLISLGGVPQKGLCIQAITFRLANGLRYTPDFVSVLQRVTAWEVKGKWVDGDSFPKLKMFAATYPEILVKLVWKQDGAWQEQTILS